VSTGSSLLLIASTSAAPASAADRVSRLEADEAHRALTGGYVARAKLDLERAAKLRASGDAENAVVAERGALTWLDAAETLARSSDGENEAASLELGALDAGARAERERALLEEALGNAGRRRAELARIERERSSVAPRTRTADIDGGVGASPSSGSATSGRSSAGAGSSGMLGHDAGGLELHLPGTAAAPGPTGTKKTTGARPTEESPP
jgi:hypothetical protein